MMAGEESVTRGAIARRLADLLNEIAQIPSDQISDEATIDNQLRMESVQFVELQVALEDEYEIEIDAIRVVEVNHFAGIVEYLFELTREGRQ